MVQPTSGPFSKVTTYPGPPTSLGFVPNHVYIARTWRRQTKPYNLPLEFFSRHAVVTSFKPTSVGAANYVQAFVTGTDPQLPLLADARNKALGKLNEDAGELSLWAVNLAEHKQAFKLITEDALTLVKFCRKLNRFDFPGAARVLKTRIPKGMKAEAKAYGNNFLKFHFGWEPLVNDIGAAIETLQNPFEPKVLKARATVTHDVTVMQDSNAKPIRYPDFKSSCRISVKASLLSENLFLASQLGFVNPLAIAWELVPFSFVADWFVNVGQFLGSFSDLAGLQLTEASTTDFQRGTGSSSWFHPTLGLVYTATYHVMYMQRVSALPTVTLRVRPWKGVSPVRAATAVSLLVQHLGR